MGAEIIHRPASHWNIYRFENWLAEGVGFEPTDGCPSPVFKTGALNRSATPPARTTLPMPAGASQASAPVSGAGSSEYPRSRPARRSRFRAAPAGRSGRPRRWHPISPRLSLGPPAPADRSQRASNAIPRQSGAAFPCLSDRWEISGPSGAGCRRRVVRPACCPARLRHGHPGRGPAGDGPSYPCGTAPPRPRGVSGALRPAGARAVPAEARPPGCPGPDRRHKRMSLAVTGSCAPPDESGLCRTACSGVRSAPRILAPGRRGAGIRRRDARRRGADRQLAPSASGRHRPARRPAGDDSGRPCSLPASGASPSGQGALHRDPPAVRCRFPMSLEPGRNLRFFRRLVRPAPRAGHHAAAAPAEAVLRRSPSIHDCRRG